MVSKRTNGVLRLDELFASRSHIRVLRALHGLPEAFPATVREIGRRASVSHPTAARVLASLADQGVLTRRRFGRADMVELTRGHRLYGELRSLFEAEARAAGELVEFLQREIPRRSPDVRRAYLYGSAARDELESRSDIDLALLLSSRAGDALDAQVGELSRDVRRRFGRRLNVVMAADPLSQLTRPRRAGREFWLRVTREGVLLVGRR